eukprot:14199437-Alexandrium_andersonii.AAC.1
MATVGPGRPWLFRPSTAATARHLSWEPWTSSRAFPSCHAVTASAMNGAARSEAVAHSALARTRDVE